MVTTGPHTARLPHTQLERPARGRRLGSEGSLGATAVGSHGDCVSDSSGPGQLSSMLQHSTRMTSAAWEADLDAVPADPGDTNL